HDDIKNPSNWRQIMKQFMRNKRYIEDERVYGPASTRQIDFIERHGLPHDPNVDEKTAWEVISDFINNRTRLPPTARQEALLRQKGQWREGMTRGEAFDAIARLLAVERATARPVMESLRQQTTNDKA